ncbi:SOS response-associated peptidase [Bifidobacterium aquikefiri]|uniref:SOS response-associated peptidase n=1 Tax=Bifidobacterium aquikefiri TaxID=1653207 RepID=UPI0039EACDF2
MCGRFAMDYVIDELADFYRAIPTGTVPERSWNIKPTNAIATILDGKDEVRHLAPSRWSLIPPWSRTSTLNFPTFNARIESVLEKRTYQHAAQFQRCIIPASGYYEWRNHKDPFYFSLHDETPLSIAGLYSWWRATPNDPWTLTSTIVTREATENVASIHNRMPVFITPDTQDEWLDPKGTAQDILPAAQSHSEELAMNLQFWQVKPLKDDGPALISKL